MLLREFVSPDDPHIVQATKTISSNSHLENPPLRPAAAATSNMPPTSNWDLQLKISPAPPAKAAKGPFSYGAFGFRVGDVVRESPDQLRRLLFPEKVKGKREQKAAADEAGRLKVSTRAWAEARRRSVASTALSLGELRRVVMCRGG